LSQGKPDVANWTALIVEEFMTCALADSVLVLPPFTKKSNPHTSRNQMLSNLTKFIQKIITFYDTK
jgi:predicted RNA-binding protein